MTTLGGARAAGLTGAEGRCGKSPALAFMSRTGVCMKNCEGLCFLHRCGLAFLSRCGDRDAEWASPSIEAASAWSL